MKRLYIRPEFWLRRFEERKETLGEEGDLFIPLVRCPFEPTRRSGQYFGHIGFKGCFGGLLIHGLNSICGQNQADYSCFVADRLCVLKYPQIRLCVLFFVSARTRRFVRAEAHSKLPSKHLSPFNAIQQFAKCENCSFPSARLP